MYAFDLSSYSTLPPSTIRVTPCNVLGKPSQPKTAAPIGFSEHCQKQRPAAKSTKFACLRIFKLISFLAVLICLSLPCAAGAEKVILAWDGTDPSADGYRMFQRTAGQAYDYNTPVWSGTATTCTIDQLTGGTYYFVVRAFKSTIESGNSNEVEHKVVINQPPQAGAGSDQAVSAGTQVTLDGSASSDPEGPIAAYQWTQTTGTSVTLANAAGAKPTFTAPNVASTSILGFELTVSDAEGLTSSDTCQVTVLPVAPVDSDNDGLTDTDETDLYGTDPNNPDTDGDGLTDGEEINTYQTDPNNADSDSDGVNDGTEISQGYDPTDPSDNDNSTQPVSEIIVDNGGEGTYSTGSWYNSAGIDYYESKSVYSKETGATYTFEAQAGGSYTVSMWWTYRASRCTDVPVKIYDGTRLLDTVYVNQTGNGGKWNHLGTYNFTGTASVVVVSKGGCSTCADAVRFAPPSLEEIIVDNGSAGTYSTGSWSNSAGIDYYESKSVYSKETGATYTFEARASGSYTVSMWWTYRASRCTDVPVKIYDGTRLLDTVYVNQTENGGQWNHLGTYHFTGTARIVVVSKGGCSTCADAVRFIPTALEEIIIDNGSDGTYSTGSWSNSAGIDYYESKSVYSKETGATYTFEARAGGSYTVSMWWTYWASRCTDVPVKIYDGSRLLDTVYVNQTENGGHWNHLGAYHFTGTARIVVVSNGGCSTCADAVRFDFGKK